MPLENLPPRMMEDLRTTIAELQMANDELRRQNQVLTASQQAAQTQCWQYRHLFELIPDACIFTDCNGAIQDANRAALALFRANRGSLEGKPLTFLMPEGGREDFEVRLGELRAAEQIEEWEATLRPLEGVDFTASIRVAVVKDSKRQAVGMHWLIRDLTQTNLAAKAFQESEERYRVIFENAPMGITHFDEDGNVVSCNRRFLNIVGAPRERVIGFNMFQSLTDLAMLAAFVKALSGRTGYYEGNYRSVTGNRVTPLRVLFSRVTTDEGKLLGTLGIWEDITERKLAEDALRESEERYRVLFEHSPLGILHFDQKGKIVSYNRQFLKILGANEEQLVGFNMLQSLRDEAMQAAVAKALSGDIGHYEGDYRSVISNHVIPLRVVYGRITADDGKPWGAVGIFEDITERRQAEAARRQLSRQRLEACNTVAHELRNSLIKIGFVFPAINSVMSFLREQWEWELRRVLSEQEDKSSLLIRLGELVLMGQPYLRGREELTQVCEDLLADQMFVANIFFLPQHGKAWLDNKIRPKWRRLLEEGQAWEECREEVARLLTLLEEAIGIVADEKIAERLSHIPEDLRVPWQKLAYTEFSTANLGYLEEVLRLLEHPQLNIKHKQQLNKLLTSLKALADNTTLIEDRMNRMLLSLKSGDELDWG